MKPSKQTARGEMKGLTYLIESPAHSPLIRADYSAFHSISIKENRPLTVADLIKLRFTVYIKDCIKRYQRLGYPLGKTRRGLKKWLKRVIIAVR